MWWFSLAFRKAKADLKVETSRAYLGILWWVLEPLSYLLAFYLIFSNRAEGDYVSFLLSGLVVWKWISSSVSTGMNAIDSNRGLISQVYMPKYVLVLSSIFLSLMKFGFVFFLLICFLVYRGYEPAVQWLMLVPLTVFVLVFLFSVVGLVAVFVPLVPDIRLLIQNGLLFLFFISGIFFDIKTLDESFIYYQQFNPVAVIVSCYRSVLFDNYFQWYSLVYFIILTMIIFSFSMLSLKYFDRKIGKMMV